MLTKEEFKDDVARIRDGIADNRISYDHESEWYIWDGINYIEPIVGRLDKMSRRITFSVGSYTTTDIDDLFDHLLISKLAN